jgi:TPR repeat protein
MAVPAHSRVAYVALLMCLSLSRVHAIAMIDPPIPPTATEVRDLLAAAMRGNVDAENSIASYYERGLGVKQSDSLAGKWFLKAAQQGNAEAIEAVVFRYETGLGLPRSHAKAVFWYRRGASSRKPWEVDGLATALAGQYANQKDLANEALWLRICADAGNLPCTLTVAKAYRNGSDGFPQDYGKGLDEYLRVVGDPRYLQFRPDDCPEIQIAQMQALGQGAPASFATAMLWYVDAMQRGPDCKQDAEFALGGLHRTGGPGMAQNDELAGVWYQRSADDGKIEAQLVLAEVYLQGRGVPQNDQLALKWYWRAATRSLDSPARTQARRELFDYLQRGRDVPRDDSEAGAWYRVHAAAGDVFAWRMLALAHELGFRATGSRYIAYTIVDRLLRAHVISDDDLIIGWVSKADTGGPPRLKIYHADFGDPVALLSAIDEYSAVEIARSSRIFYGD